MLYHILPDLRNKHNSSSSINIYFFSINIYTRVLKHLHTFSPFARQIFLCSVIVYLILLMPIAFKQSKSKDILHHNECQTQGTCWIHSWTSMCIELKRRDRKYKFNYLKIVQFHMFIKKLTLATLGQLTRNIFISKTNNKWNRWKDRSCFFWHKSGYDDNYWGRLSSNLKEGSARAQTLDGLLRSHNM